MRLCARKVAMSGNVPKLMRALPSPSMTQILHAGDCKGQTESKRSQQPHGANHIKILGAIADVESFAGDHASCKQGQIPPESGVRMCSRASCRIM